MKTQQNIKKDARTELAWKELIEAVKPLKKSLQAQESTDKKAALNHPALITTNDFNRWEIFG